MPYHPLTRVAGDPAVNPSDTSTATGPDLASLPRRRYGGWGNHPVESCRAARPERRAELRAILSAAAEGRGPSVLPRGLGRSYGDAALNAEGVLLLQERLNRIRAFDETTGVLECEAGVTAADLLEVFLPRGFVMPVTPGTRHVTLGGAIASDVHGKNHHHDGTILSFVEEFTLVGADGREHRCSRRDHGGLILATAGAQGLTGIILDLRLRLRRVETAFVRVRRERARDLEHAFAIFDRHDAHHPYSVAWLDTARRRGPIGAATVMHGRHAALDELPTGQRAAPFRLPPSRARAIPCFAPGFALNRTTIAAFNRLHAWREREGDALEPFDRFMYPLDGLDHWNRLYGRRGFVQYQLVIPEARAFDGVRRVLERVVGGDPTSFLTVLKRMGPATGGPLSFPMPGWTLALDLPNTGPSLERLVRDLDAIVLESGGRVYLAKDSMLTPEAFRIMYPRVEEFRRIKAAIDPRGLFDSSLARRLRLTGGRA